MVHNHPQVGSARRTPSNLCGTGNASGVGGLFGLPPSAVLLSSRERCAYLRGRDFEEMPFLPVTHTNHTNWGVLDRHYYYLAAGCSDMYVRTGVAVVADSPFDLLFQLVARKLRRNFSDLVDLAQQELRRNNVSACGRPAHELLPHKLRGVHPCTTHNPTRASPFEQCVWDWRPRLKILAAHGRTHVDIARAAQVDTLILRHQGSGPGGSCLRCWKTEVVRALPFESDIFYNAALERCSIQGKPLQCIRCKSKVPLLDQACKPPKRPPTKCRCV